MQRIKRLFLLKILCLFLYTASYSQDHTKSTNDIGLASQYFSKADVLLIKWKLDSAIVYYKKALIAFEETAPKKLIADTHDKIAECYRKNYDLDDALNHAEKALAIRLETFKPTHSEIAFSYNSIGHILKEQDKFQKAMDLYQNALEIQLDNFGEEDYRTADSYHNIGTIHHILAEYNKGLDNYNKALTIRIKAFGKNHQKVANSYVDIGTTHYHLGKNKKALDFYYKALEIRSIFFGKHSPEVAFCYNHMGDILLLQDKFDEAKKYQKKASTIMFDTFEGDHLNIAISYTSLGVLNRRLGKHDIALRYNFKALDIIRKKIEETSFQASTPFNEIGIIYLKKGFYDKALYYHNKSLLIKLEKLPKNHSYIGGAYNNIGYTYLFIGKYDKAISYYKRAINNFSISLGNEHSVVARTYNNIANTYKAKKEYDLALVYYQKALKIKINLKGENHSDTSITYHDIADIYLIKKEYNIALQYYTKALEIHKRLFGKVNYYVSDINNAIGTVYSKMNKYDIALEYFEKSIKIRLHTDGKHHPKTAKSYNLIAEVYYQIKEHAKALNHYDKAILANTNLTIKPSNFNELDLSSYMDGNLLLQTLYGKAKVSQDLYKENGTINNLILGIETYAKADTLIQEIRETLHTYQDKITFAQKVQEIYTGAIQAQLLLYENNKKQQHIEQAFYYAEKSKANTLKDLLTESNAKGFAELPNTILDLEQNLKSDRAFYISEITAEKSSENLDTTKITHYENMLFDISRKQDSLTLLLEKNYPKYYQLKHQNNTISVTDIQKKLHNNTTLIEFFVSDSISYAFTISKNNIKATTLSTPKLTEYVERSREAIISKNTASFKAISHQLYKLLIHPIKDQIIGNQLIIIPDGPLWHLNFELLLTQNDVSNNPKTLSYLLKEYAISYANSATLLFNPFKNDLQSKKRQECLAFSFSDSTNIIDTKAMSLESLRGAGDDLPGTRKEIKAISDIIDGQYYYGSQAIEANFKKNANQYNILHLALHGEVDNEHPENSKLFFTKIKDSIEDNFLYSHELFALDIPAELTVLSACNTGSGKIAKGEGIMSLGNAFQYAGTKSLLLSSWGISDQTTPELMKNFYTNLKKGMNKAKALQQAKLDYLHTANPNRTDPFYWGGFYLVGDITPIEFDNNNRLYWSIATIIIGILFMVIWLYRRKLRNK